MTEKIDISQRVAALVRMSQAANSAAAKLFGPGQAMTPVTDEEQPRLYEYLPGVNMIMQPRAGYGVLSFAALRALAQTCKEIRANIELIKRTMRGLRWKIIPKTQSGVSGYEHETTSVQLFWERPDGINSFDAWMNMLLEDLLVIDAVTIYPDTDANGHLVSLDIVDGATIRPLVDMRGRIPRPPAPAYIQVLHGVPTSWYTADKLIYAPLNTKANTPYGESPIEWAIMAFNTAIHHDLQRLGAFTDGNIPGVLVSVNMETTSPEQVEMFQQYFDALTKGDVYRASKILFVPSGGQAQSIFQPSQPNADNIEADRWLMQVACWAFGNNPAQFALVDSPGLGGAGYVQGMENAHYRSMIGPISGYLASLFTDIISRYMKRPDLKFVWDGLEPPEDESQRAQIDAIYINAGVYPVEYVQDRLGIPEKYRASQPAAPTPAYNLSALAPILERAARYELGEWRRNAIAIKKGVAASPYVPVVLPVDLVAEIDQQVRAAPNADAVAAIFGDLLAGNVLAKRLVTPAAVDPLDAVKTAAEREMQQVISEYFDGLQKRIIAYVTSQATETVTG